MAADFEVRIEGAKDIERSLKELPKGAAKRALTTALRFAGAPMRKDARALAPSKTGLLRKSIGLAAGKKFFPNSVQLFLVVRRVAFYWRWVEEGLPQRGIKAQPYLQPAIDKNKGKVIKRFGEMIWTSIKKQAAKTRTIRR